MLLRAHANDRTLARADFLDVARVFLEERVVGRDKDRRRVGIHQGDDTVLQFGARVARAEHVADFFQLEGGFEGDGILELAPHEKHAVRVGVFLCHLGKVRVHFEDARDFFRQRLQLLDDAQTVRTGEVADPAHQEREQRENGDLGSE